MKEISEFQGEFRFLSNFWPAEVELDGVKFPTVEHAFQAAKVDGPKTRLQIRDCGSPGRAKRFLKKAQIEPREGWDSAKLQVMKDLLRQKFSVEPLRSQLLATGCALLIEGNTWGDTFWGVCNQVGSNWLGNLLMEVRSELRRE